jgi:CO/xanthine dehydrogenase FAD-binding subunit
LDENRTLRLVDVLTPTTLADALALKAEHPGARPIQGGTDLMVALNFDRERPAELINLNEVAELRGWGRRTARCGSARA